MHLQAAELIASGVVLSLLFTIFKTMTLENPAGVPLGILFPRALFGFVLFFVAYFVLASAEHELLLLIVPARLIPQGAERWACLVGLGALSPSVMFLKVRPIGRHLPFSFREALQAFDEITRLYLLKLIRREERKAHSKVVRVNRHAAECAIDRLYETHVIDVIVRIFRNHRSHRNHRKPDRASILGLRRIRHPAVKSKHLLRHLGYVEFFEAVHQEIAEGKALSPNWPVSERDRRCGRDRRTKNVRVPRDSRGTGKSRRKTDSIDLDSLALESPDT